MSLFLIVTLLFGGCSRNLPADEKSRPRPAPDPRAHALVIVVDTLRADIATEVDTPVMDSLAEEGDYVPRAWSSGTWTVPSVISLFTGMSVRQHGWNHPTGNVASFPQIPPAPTLAEVLKERGFVTDGYYANDFLKGELGFSRGFDTWIRTSDLHVAERLAHDVETWTDGERHFVYVHLLNPHSPLRPTESTRTKYKVNKKWTDDPKGFLIGVCKRNRLEGAREAYGAAYRAVVEDTDAMIGDLLKAIAPVRDDTVIIVTSDHGELLGEHGFCGHGHWVWEQLTRVPFIAVGVGRLPDTTTIASVPSLVSRSLGIDYQWPATPPLPLVSEREEKLALTIDGQLKGIWHDEKLSVYDLSDDPLEAEPLPEQVQKLQEARHVWEDSVGPRPEATKETTDFDPEVLKALGYLQEDGQ
ncbi:MAG: sulfatase-like hydrolase/transferase [Proteobacteria bacterium]|jgi:hypothetical protein|nr:sulfatase-like hydrolase/transferase [Pseudomonadota bacterium]